MPNFESFSLVWNSSSSSQCQSNDSQSRGEMVMLILSLLLQYWQRHISKDLDSVAQSSKAELNDEAHVEDKGDDDINAASSSSSSSSSAPEDPKLNPLQHAALAMMGIKDPHPAVVKLFMNQPAPVLPPLIHQSFASFQRPNNMQHELLMRQLSAGLTPTYSSWPLAAFAHPISDTSAFTQEICSLCQNRRAGKILRCLSGAECVGKFRYHDACLNIRSDKPWTCPECVHCIHIRQSFHPRSMMG